MVPLSLLKEHLEKQEAKQIPETIEEEPTDAKQNLFLLRENQRL
jgi:hypothetical protein